MLDIPSLELLERATRHLAAGFSSLPPSSPPVVQASLESVLLEVAERLQDNFPYGHPLYAGQMLKPPHPVARLAYALAMAINPNNHAIDGGRASSAMEKEAVAQLASMVGWKQHLGHLTSGGTMANLEALWIAGQLAPDGVILASQQAHYTHERLCGVLRLAFESVAVDRRARISLDTLEQRLKQGGVSTVVATLGTSALGAVDPLDEIVELKRRYGFRLHVDAAYGGYFRLLTGDLEPSVGRAFEALSQVDSLVIDPHKHGLQPYGCGCVLLADPELGRFYRHDSPYTYFSSAELHLGEISLECSRPGASAVALWATQRLLPLEPGGDFAAGLRACLHAARDLYQKLQTDDWWTPWEPQLDLLVWLPRGRSSSQISALSQRIYEEAEKRSLFLALTQVGQSQLEHLPIEWDCPQVTCLRSCLMKPEHGQWLGEMQRILEAARSAAQEL